MIYQPILDETLQFADTLKINTSHFCFYVDPQTTDTVPLHIHGCYEIYVNVGGDVSFLHEQKIYDITSGNVIFSKPGEAHYCIYPAPCLHDHYCIWFDDASGTIGEFCNRITIPPAIQLSEAGKEQLFRLIDDLSDPNTDSLLKIAKLIEMLALFGKGTLLPHDSQSNRPQIITELLLYIESNYKSIRTTADLANAFYISQPTLNRLFRKHVGLTVSQIINAKRLSHAENLLREGASVTDACFASGFTDCSQFIVLFRKTFGVTPLRYKQTLNKNKDIVPDIKYSSIQK